jgi:hypothetical protein
MDSSQGDHDLDGMIANSISRSNNTDNNNTRAGRSSAQQQQQQSSLQDSRTTLSSSSLLEANHANTSPTSPIYGFNATSSVHSPLAHLALQPGMSPAIQRGTSLGLALGGSGFRRKPLFEPEEEDDEEFFDEEQEGLDQKAAVGKSKKQLGRRKGTTARTFQSLTRSTDDAEDHDSTLDRTGGDREGEEEYEDGDEDDEEDADSETPLHPQEPIRGLE